MRIALTALTIALLAAWTPVTAAQAQCDPSMCTNPNRVKAKKPAMKKPVATKKMKKEKVEYMKAAN